MKLLFLIGSLLVSHGLGAPVNNPSDVSSDVSKRRESTPEILDLEHQLKKAAGENKHYFSNPETRPMPQVDGLANENDPQDSLVNPGDSSDQQEDENETDLENLDLGNMAEYMPMWKTLKDHPEYMEAMFKDYMNNYGRENEDPDNAWPSYPDSDMDKDSYPYPLENELTGLGPVEPQGDMYPNFDINEDEPQSLVEQQETSENQEDGQETEQAEDESEDENDDEVEPIAIDEEEHQDDSETAEQNE